MNNCNCNRQCGVPEAKVVPCTCEFVIPAAYPYVRPAVDSYTCSCCGNIEPTMKDYPSSGPFKGSAFALDNANPYLIDSTYMSYGQALTFAENIYTQVTKKDDPSCINLVARFDMTDSTLTNMVRFDFLKNYTARKYEELSGVLPIIKSGIKFRVHYIVYNIDGGIEYEGHSDMTVNETHFHFTSIKDVFVQSAQGLIIDNIPAMTFQGQYTICITHVEAFVNVIDTKSHLQDPSLNPYYTFTDNNRKIILHNTEITGETPDSELLIGDCMVQKSFPYLANVTTRLRLSFITFTSLPIACGDTSPIWFALNEPTEQSITQLRNEVSAMEEQIAALVTRINNQDATIAQLTGQVELNRQNISDLVNRVTALETSQLSQDLIIQTLGERVAALEAIPLALVSYRAGKEIVRSQITWKGYGNLFQCAETYTPSGDFDADVAAGFLVPVTSNAEDISGITTKLNDVEATASEAYEMAGDAIDVVNGLSDELAVLVDGKNKVIIKNLATGEYQFVNSYGAAANVIREDLDGEYSIFPGDGYSQQTISAEMFANVSSLAEITFPESITTIGADAFAGCDGIIINIPKPEDSVTGSPWGATNAVVNWTE